MTNFYPFLLIGIIFLATALRFFQLGMNPPSLDWDEASLGYNAYSILKTGADEYGNFLPLSIRSFDDYKPPMYVYLTVPSVAVFGLTEFAVRLPAAIIGVLSVLMTYLLVNEFFVAWRHRKQIALVSAFLLAISPWHLQFSRAAFEGNVGLFFLILALYLFFLGLKKPFFFVLSSLAFVGSLYSYHSFRMIDVFILILLGLLFFNQLKKVKKWVLIAIVLLVIAGIPIYGSFIRPEGTGARLSMVTIFSDDSLAERIAKQVESDKKNNDALGEFIHNRRFVYMGAVAKGYLDHFSFDFLFVHGDTGVQHHAVNMGMLYLWELPFILLGLFFLRSKIDRRIFVLLFIFLVAPLPASITTGTPHPVRAIAMIPAFHIFTAVGFVMFMSIVFQKKQHLRWVIAAVIVVALGVNVAYYLRQYYIATPIEYGYFWQYGNKEAIEYAKQHESEYDSIIMSYRYDQPYVYYLFHNEVDPAWYQKNWDYSKTGKIDRFFRVIGKYEFKNIEFSKDSQKRKALLIGTPEEIPETAEVLKEIRFPDGKVAYKIIKT